uniref:glycogenin glucosyltransferase n=1 Tax=Sinocyclocheilus grahami TaxID=75366 RepID=A0A672L0Q0_SINGR
MRCWSQNLALFEYEELSAAPDPGWPDCFNSGVFVFRPSLNTHIQILEHAAQHGGDQGVLNTFFSDWAVKDIRKHLSIVYNLTVDILVLYRYGYHAKFVHFLGGTKPWHLSYDPQAANESSFRDSIKNFQQFIHLWCDSYKLHSHQISCFHFVHSNNTYVAQLTVLMTYSYILSWSLELQAAAETEVDDLEHRSMWEEGRADYMGKDAFNNIMRKHDLFLY